jgi:hypothetical protein
MSYYHGARTRYIDFLEARVSRCERARRNNATSGKSADIVFVTEV